MLTTRHPVDFAYTRPELEALFRYAHAHDVDQGGAMTPAAPPLTSGPTTGGTPRPSTTRRSWGPSTSSGARRPACGRSKPRPASAWRTSWQSWAGGSSTPWVM